MTDLFKWIYAQLAILLAIVEIKAGVAGLVLGIAMSDFIPRMLSPNMDVHFAARITRLFVFAFSASAAFWLNTTPLGLVIACTVGASSASVQALMMRYLYSRVPSLRPVSLTPSIFNQPPPPSILPKSGA